MWAHLTDIVVLLPYLHFILSYGKIPTPTVNGNSVAGAQPLELLYLDVSKSKTVSEGSKRVKLFSFRKK